MALLRRKEIQKETKQKNGVIIIVGAEKGTEVTPTQTALTIMKFMNVRRPCVATIYSLNTNNVPALEDRMALEEVRKAAELLIDLYKQYSNDRDAYSNGKKEFIEDCLLDAYVYKEMRHKFDITDRLQCLLHGDFHEGNLMVGDDDELYVIDLLDEGFGNCGDPWYDFRAFSRNSNVYFITGLIRGYFNGEAPGKFWDVLTYYFVTATITAVVWMQYNRPEELAEILKQNEKNAQLLRDGRLLQSNAISLNSIFNTPTAYHTSSKHSLISHFSANTARYSRCLMTKILETFALVWRVTENAIS